MKIGLKSEIKKYHTLIAVVKIVIAQNSINEPNFKHAKLLKIACSKNAKNREKSSTKCHLTFFSVKNRSLSKNFFNKRGRARTNQVSESCFHTVFFEKI